MSCGSQNAPLRGALTNGERGSAADGKLIERIADVVEAMELEDQFPAICEADEIHESACAAVGFAANDFRGNLHWSSVSLTDEIRLLLWSDQL
jgi:hypothetical protein